MTEQQPITWNELREDIAALHEGLAGARDQANEAVLNPPDGRTLDRIYVDAYADLRFEVDGLARRAEALLERIAEAQPPARPLETVLADIEAEGHRAWTIVRYPSGMVRAETALPEPEQPASDAGKEAWDSWRAAREQGEVWNNDTAASSADVPALLEARLAQLREKRAAAVAAVEAQVASDAEAMLEGAEASDADPSENEGLVWDRNEDPF